MNSSTAIIHATTLELFTTVPPADHGHMPPVWGYIAVLVASVFFGSNLVPVKKFETGDGKYLQSVQACLHLYFHVNLFFKPVTISVNGWFVVTHRSVPPLVFHLSSFFQVSAFTLYVWSVGAICYY